MNEILVVLSPLFCSLFFLIAAAAEGRCNIEIKAATPFVRSLRCESSFQQWYQSWKVTAAPEGCFVCFFPSAAISLRVVASKSLFVSVSFTVNAPAASRYSQGTLHRCQHLTEPETSPRAPLMKMPSCFSVFPCRCRSRRPLQPRGRCSKHRVPSSSAAQIVYSVLLQPTAAEGR